MSRIATRQRIQSLSLCALFAALSAIGAFIRIPLPEPLVPFTLQTLFVMLAAMILGAKRAMAAEFAYLAIGLLGIPVFTQGGGPQYLLKPTFGYLLGFVLAAYITGKLAERFKASSVWRLFVSGLIGLLAIYIVGAGYLYLIKNFYLAVPSDIWSVLYAGVLIFLPTDIASCFVAALCAHKLLPRLKQLNLLS